MAAQQGDGPMTEMLVVFFIDQLTGLTIALGVGMIVVEELRR